MITSKEQSKLANQMATKAINLFKHWEKKSVTVNEEAQVTYHIQGAMAFIKEFHPFMYKALIKKASKMPDNY